MRDGIWFLRNEALDNAGLQPILFRSKSLTSMESHFSKIEREALGILNDLETFHHYYFAHNVSVIKGHGLLVRIYKDYIVSQSHRLQRILLQIHQHNVKILYKPEPKLYITD